MKFSSFFLQPIHWKLSWAVAIDIFYPMSNCFPMGASLGMDGNGGMGWLLLLWIIASVRAQHQDLCTKKYWLIPCLFNIITILWLFLLPKVAVPQERGTITLPFFILPLLYFTISLIAIHFLPTAISHLLYAISGGLQDFWVLLWYSILSLYLHYSFMSFFSKPNPFSIYIYIIIYECV